MTRIKSKYFIECFSNLVKGTTPIIVAGWGGTMDKKRRVPDNDIAAIPQILSDLFMIILFIRILSYIF